MIACPHPWVDVDRYPIVVIAFPAESTAMEVRSMTAAMRRFAANVDEPIAIVSDLSQIRSSDPETRSIYVEFVRDMRSVAGQWVRATAVVTQSAFQRTVLNLHSMLVGKTPYPVRGFACRAEAMPWLHARLGSSVR